MTKPHIDSRATIIAVCAGLTLSLSLAHVVARWDREDRINTFRAVSRDRVAVFGWKLGETLAAFTSLIALFDASQQVDPPEFRAFADRLLQAQPTIAAIAWLPRVVVADGDSARGTAADGSADRYPIAQVVPTAGYERLLGLDCATHQACGETMRESLLSGGFAVSARMGLPIGAAEEQKIVAFAPVYPHGTSHHAIRLGSAQPQGLVAVLFDAKTVWEHGVAHLQPAGIDIEVHDLTEPTRPTVLYRRASRLGTLSPSTPLRQRARSAQPDGIREEFDVPIAGRRWIVSASATPGFITANASSRSSIALLGGLAITTLVGLHLFLRARHTQALIETNSRLRDAREDIALKETQLRRIIDLVPHLIFVRDREGAVLLANRATADACGTSIAELINGARESGLAARLDALDAPARSGRVEAGQQLSHVKDVQFEDARGRRRRLDATTIPYKLPGSQEPALLCVAVDQTELRAAEAAKVGLERELRHSQKMESIGLLAGGIAHDFNNLLGSIIGNTELALGKAPHDAPIVENLTEVLDASEHASNLVAQILTFSRKDDLELGPLRPGVVVDGALELMRGSIPSHIELLRDIDEEFGLVLGDKTQLAQVVMNLCSNAFQAIGDRPGHVTVRLSRIDLSAHDAQKHSGLHPGPYVRLQVSDDGCGMTTDIHERIFDPFFTTKEVGMGTGLGLSVVHGIVAAHRGMITVDTTTGVGSTFSVYLPEADGSVSSFRYPKRSVITGNGRILLVDDDVALLRTVAEMLEMLGYEPTTAEGGNEALALLRANPDGFDAVITDQAMPKMTGVELASEIRTIRPLLPVILATGFSEQITEYNAASQGLRGFLTKPYRANELGTTLQVVLGLHAPVA